MNDNFIGIYVLVGIISLTIFFFLMRWVFGVDRHLKNQRATIAFLIKLCRQQDVPEAEIDELKQKFEL